MIIFHPMKRLGLLAIATVLSGHAGMASSNETGGRIRITSEPAGAAAFADGTELGVTPLEIVPGEHFRSGFVGFSYRYYGKLAVKKAGCETRSTEVNDNILSRDMHVKLKCDPNFRPVTPSTGANPVSGQRSGDPMIDRLERIETLHKKGLISDEEYKRLRTRVIEKL
jgi:hypothetical protein